MIEINGHRYDAVTGRLLDGMQRAVSGVGSVDGIVRAKSNHIKHHSKRSINTIKRQTQRSQTLMRKAVKKPAATKTVEHKSVINHQPSRDLRSKIAGLKPGHKTQSVAKHHASVEGEVIHRQRSSAMAVATPMPNISDNLSNQKIERLLDLALTRADAHKEAKRSAKRSHKALNMMPKWLNITLITFMVLAIGGFIAWQKVPAISLKVAASKAHVDSSMPSIPGYTASSTASVKNGALSIKYTSISDSSQTATVTKKPAATGDVNSIAKKECPNEKELQTVSGNGNVGFICGQSKKAALINNGVLTEIEPNSSQALSNGTSNLLPTP